ncbi:glycoside hydrolase family 2 TIM barrel-domain containing protein [Paenibacillus camelliae]|uniref:glycoside hydrolase family 2 TIM barrel-domain containing protein n=1 Tax=Paenibacillus camelliae TaxID=512410 RepID=UPI00203B3227|nr:glycoside hydrolase family 2 TIM barrel-domain containing protein [Paenibacillus camelliae]MCM3633015.1 DUF4981 domain-containing protein [Paenibacillus camelliae]
MTTVIPTLDWLADPAVFAVNRVEAHSDHRYYETLAEAETRGEMRLRHSLNGAWKFSYSSKPADRSVAFYETGFSVDSWDFIEVPGHIQMQGYGKPQYVNTMYPWDGIHELRPPQVNMEDNPVGSYVKTFNVPQHMKNLPLFISFQGVESAFYVWLNGKFVGYSEDSFTPSEFELTPYLTDGENKLAVEVYQRSTGSWLEDQDFWRFSGIFRDVYLYATPKLHIEDLFVQAGLDDQYSNGNLSVDIKLMNAAAASVELLLKTADQVLVAESKQDIAGQATVSVEPGVVQPWSAESPYLYSLYVIVRDEHGEIVEVLHEKIGFRRFEIIDKVMHINGKRIIFKGVNRHEFNPRRGRAITKEDMLSDIQTIKQNNLNAVRTSHYPNQSLWYELCDEYGIYLIDEMNLETHGSWQKMGKVDPSWNIPLHDKEWEAIVMDRAISMLERDKNHPSVLIWSLGNESYVGEVLLNVANYFRKADHTRLVHYEGVFYDRNFSACSDMESRMYAKPADIEAYLNNNPEKPYISCEYIHAMGNSLGGMHKYIELEDKYPMYQGGFIWDYIDQMIVKKDRYGKEFLAYGGDFDDRSNDNNFCGNGIVYADRTITPKMQEVKFLYQNIKLTPSRNTVLVCNDNLFIGTGDYKLVITLARDGEVLEQQQLTIDVPAGEQREYELAWTADQSAAGEYTVTASVQLAEATRWAEVGHEVAFGQHRFIEAKQEAPLQQRTFRVAEGDVNVGVHGSDFSIMFSKGAGTLISVNYDGREMIAQPPHVLFWRATTDNDKGYAQGYERALWYAASLSRRCVGFELEQSEYSVTVTFTYKFSIHSELEVKVAYTVTEGGNIAVKADYSGAEGLPTLPIFALSFKVPANYDLLDWYAMGPEENYIDRVHGARLMTFQNRAQDNVARYVVPQESGNRTGVRRVAITNELKQGLVINSSPEAPVECRIAPYTAFELENAVHHYELPNVHYTVVTVAGKQMGVGGDDSWGAPVHPEYHIASEQTLSFEFTISRAK